MARAVKQTSVHVSLCIPIQDTYLYWVDCHLWAHFSSYMAYLNMSICSVLIVYLSFVCMHYGSIASGQPLHSYGTVKCGEANSNLKGDEY